MPDGILGECWGDWLGETEENYRQVTGLTDALVIGLIFRLVRQQQVRTWTDLFLYLITHHGVDARQLG
jgi:hypothetical protein